MAFNPIEVQSHNGQNIDIVNEFTYLGIVLTTNGSFCKNKEKLVSQARKAMYSIFKYPVCYK
jgi:hypothetical protein